MQTRHLSHLVLYVRDLQRSLAFYRGLLGLQTRGETFGRRARMLTGDRTRHELLLLEVGDTSGPLAVHRLGLYHVGWCVGDGDAELVAAKRELEVAGVVLEGMSDHWVSHSLYLRDPDGNEVEPYVDVPDYDWRHQEEWLRQPVRSLRLDDTAEPQEP